MAFTKGSFVQVERDSVWVKARVEELIEGGAVVFGFDERGHFFQHELFYDVADCPDCAVTEHPSGICAGHRELVQ